MGSVFLIFFVFCVVLCYFTCLQLVPGVLNATSVSGLSILDYPFSFLTGEFEDTKGVISLQQVHILTDASTVYNKYIYLLMRQHSLQQVHILTDA